MKRIIIISCCIMITLFCSQTAGAEDVYSRLSLGLAKPGNSDIMDEANPGTRVVAKFKNNMHASIALGKEYGSFRIEGEMSYQTNDFESASLLGADVDITGDMSILALLINGYYDFKNKTDFTPYLSAGFGGSSMWMSGLSVPAASFVSGTGDDIVAAYQIGCGLIYKMDEIISFDLNYKYFVPSDSEFNTIQTEFTSHNVSLGLRINF